MIAHEGEPVSSVRRTFGRWWLVLFGVALGGVMGSADLATNGSPSRAVTDVTMAILVGYTLVLMVFRGRSETASVLAGHPVDERWQAINLHAVAAAGMIGAFVALGGFIAAEETGHDWSGFAIVAAAIGAGYVGGVIWFRWRL
jgi:hypothetical protein